MYHKTFQEGELYMHRRSLEGFVKLESLISSGEEKWVSHAYADQYSAEQSRGLLQISGVHALCSSLLSPLFYKL